MPFFGKLMDAQKRFDEETITRLKDRYKLEHRGSSSAELQAKLDNKQPYAPRGRISNKTKNSRETRIKRVDENVCAQES